MSNSRAKSRRDSEVVDEAPRMMFPPSLTNWTRSCGVRFDPIATPVSSVSHRLGLPLSFCGNKTMWSYCLSSYFVRLADGSCFGLRNVNRYPRSRKES